MNNTFRLLEINGGVVTQTGETTHFWLPPGVDGYADAQMDGYGVPASPIFPRSRLPFRAGLRLALNARFSHPAGQLQGTAGFGFWNAPFADPSIKWPALPQAVWFFYASPPADLPLAVSGPGRGWFVGTIDAGTRTAVSLIPFAPIFLLLNRVPSLHHLWPMVRRKLGISFHRLPVSMTAWHSYRLDWLPQSCSFYVDGEPVYQTSLSPRGPLGFVCWLDNQYLALNLNGRFRWGTLPIPETQWMDVTDLEISRR